VPQGTLANNPECDVDAQIVIKIVKMNLGGHAECHFSQFSPLPLLLSARDASEEIPPV
jgi:hypothetical protein